MSKKNKEKSKLNWYDSANVISTLIIISIVVIIICSQSFAVVGESSLALFGSVINYNSIYILALVYFVFLKFKFGKRYFNYLNLFLIFVYFLATVTSLLTLIQSFGLKTLLIFIMNSVLLIYLVHTLFRDSRVWKEFKLGKSPFNEISNDMYFYVLIILVIFTLAVNLISTVYLSGVILSFLDAIYMVLFGRFVYLYRDYLDFNKKDIDNEGNFDSVKESIQNVVDSASDKVQGVLDKTDLDEKIVETVHNIHEKTTEKVQDILDKTDLDEKIVETVHSIHEKTTEKVQDVLDKTDIDDKNNKKKSEKINNTKEKKNTNKKKGEDK